MKKILIMMIGMICWIPGVIIAEEFDLRGGYKVSIGASTKGKQVRVDGRIKDGEDCKNLRLDIFAYNDLGGIAHIVTAVKDAGGSGSRIIEGADTLILRPTGRWEVRNIYGDCVKK